MNKRISAIFKGDGVIWMIFFFLCLISVVEVFSASSGLTYKSGNYFSPFIKHIGLLGLGFVCMVITLNFKCRYFKFATPFLIGLSFITLIIVFFVGETTNGAQRWIPIFGFQFQPSEIAKGSLVLATAQILSAMETEHGADRHAMKYILIVCAFIVPFIMTENLSTAALLCAVLFLMMFIGRVPPLQLGKLAGSALLLVVLGIAAIMAFGKTPSSDPKAQTAQTTATANGKQAKEDGGGAFSRVNTWKGRIVNFFDGKEVKPQDVDLNGKGSQSAHANIAIASSNIIGRGPGNSVERDFLSQAFSDFIYAIIIEETGIEGAIFVALLYVFLLFRVGKIASRCENNFPALLAMGLALLIVIQALFNMCVAVGLAPVTGQPLPLISKGGTSTIMNCIYIGVILSVSRTAKKREPATATEK